LLGQNIEKYRSLFPHVCAAIQSGTNEDRLPSKGDNIKYIYTDAQHSNPLCRVIPVKEIEKENLRYDREKYKGFDRTIYEDKINMVSKRWRWLQEIRQQREKDIKIEMI
jgi:hypothetical protein